ncbi:MAG: phosphoadenylyl-sulfate reductase [Dehalococcoidia bacterium]
MEFTTDELKALSDGLEDRAPQDALHWAIDAFFPAITLACSFGGISGMALLDMALKIEPRLRVHYIDTDLLFPETYALRDRVIARYGIQPVAVQSLLTLAEQAQRYGDALWAHDPDLCCQLRKVEPSRRALAGMKAWIAGLRRDQATTRRHIGIVERDDNFGLVKVNPLANWDERQVWDYITKNDVPYNPLHDRGYPSIGCTHCTRPVTAGADPRSGRWVGFAKTECGLHTPQPQR